MLLSSEIVTSITKIIFKKKRKNRKEHSIKNVKKLKLNIKLNENKLKNTKKKKVTITMSNTKGKKLINLIL